MVANLMFLATAGLLPFNVEAVATIGDHVFYLQLFEVPLIALAVVGVFHYAKPFRRRWSWQVVFLLLFLALITLSYIRDPSALAGMRLFRFGLAVVFVRWASRREAPWGLLTFVLLLGTGAQMAIVAGQIIAGGPVGLARLGEASHLSLVAGDIVYAKGTFFVHHAIAAFAAVGMVFGAVASWTSRSLIPLVGAGFSAAILGMTFSRMGLVAYLGVLCSTLGLLRLDRKKAVRILVVLVLALAVPATATRDAWLQRGEETVRGTDPDDRGADVGGRLALAGQAISVIERYPWTGTGIGDYLDQGRLIDPEIALQPHNVVLMAAAESGMAAGLALSLFLASVAVVGARHGALGWMAFWSLLPFLALDHFPMDRPTGMGITALWLALCWRLRAPSPVSPPRPGAPQVDPLPR